MNQRRQDGRSGNGFKSLRRLSQRRILAQ